MAAEQRKLLEQLMGDQALHSTVRAPKAEITDPKVCHSYLVGTCPHDLFTNTKQDLGICPNLHNDALKTEWQEASDEQKQKWGFEFDYQRDLQRHIDVCNRRIDNLRGQLEKTPEEIRKTAILLQETNKLTKNIEGGLLEIEVLCKLGSVNLAVTEYQKIRHAKVKKEEHERELQAISDTSGPSGHQKLQVCDVCGAYLSRLDNDRRLADHFFGKLHMGYAQIRKMNDALREQLKDRKQPARNDYSHSNGYGGRGDYSDRGGWDDGGHGRGGFSRQGGGGYRGGGRGSYGGGRGGGRRF